MLFSDRAKGPVWLLERDTAVREFEHSIAAEKWVSIRTDGAKRSAGALDVVLFGNEK